MPQAQTRTLTAPDGTEVDIKPLGRVDDDTIRVEIDGNCRWRLVVTEDGEYDLEASWDSDDNLADVPLPDYLDESLKIIGAQV